MYNQDLLEKFAQMLLVNNEQLMNFVSKEMRASEKRIKEELTEDLTKRIERSEDAVIETLSDLMHTGIISTKYGFKESRTS